MRDPDVQDPTDQTARSSHNRDVFSNNGDLEDLITFCIPSRKTDFEVAIHRVGILPSLESHQLKINQ